MRKVLGPDFFNRPAVKVAKDLIGMHLVRKVNGEIIADKITEAEAYVGPHDLACHAAKGRTKRTEVMFCEGGTLYVYFVYGMHWMLNVVTGEKDYPAAVLIRGTEKWSGPGRLTRAFSIDKILNGAPANKRTGLWFEDRGRDVSPRNISATPRIGVNYAGPVWAKKPYRFVLTTPAKKKAVPTKRRNRK